MDQSHILTVVGNTHGDTNISVNIMTNVPVMIQCSDSSVLSNKMQLAVVRGQSPAITREEDYHLVIGILNALRTSHCGMLNMVVRKELKTAEQGYIKSADDRDLALREIRSAELGEPVK